MKFLPYLFIPRIRKLLNVNIISRDDTFSRGKVPVKDRAAFNGTENMRGQSVRRQTRSTIYKVTA